MAIMAQRSALMAIAKISSMAEIISGGNKGHRSIVAGAGGMAAAWRNGGAGGG